jgi:hypothetical protein
MKLKKNKDKPKKSKENYKKIENRNEKGSLKNNYKKRILD